MFKVIYDHGEIENEPLPLFIYLDNRRGESFIEPERIKIIPGDATLN